MNLIGVNYAYMVILSLHAVTVIAHIYLWCTQPSTYQYELDNSTLCKIYDDRPRVPMGMHREYVLNTICN